MTVDDPSNSSSNGIEETLEESSHEPEAELESESKPEELKPEAEEKNIEELEEKSPSPPPVETVALPQEPPKVGLVKILYVLKLKSVSITRLRRYLVSHNFN